MVLGCLPCMAIKLIIKLYLWSAVVSFVIFLGLYAAVLLTKDKVPLNYKLKHIFIYYSVIMGVGFVGLLFIVRPRRCTNVLACAWLVRKVSFLMGITWEVRGANILSKPEAAIIVANHQSSLDIFGMLNIWEVPKQMTAIAKKEILYVLPFGPACWLVGIIFINRKNAKQAFKIMDDAVDDIKKHGDKLVIFPEGTRNTDRTFLPFKKGAFVQAIKSQVPIIPLVMSPYYFVDSKKKTYTRGHMIYEALPAVSTKGKTLDDVNELLESIKNDMETVFKRLCREVDEKSLLPSWQNKPRPRLTLVNK